MIINNFDGMYWELVMPLLKNYGSNILFTIFLYPHISQKTLLEIKNCGIFYEIFPYLKNVCNNLPSLIESMHTLVFSTSDDGFVLNRIFNWPRKSISRSSEIPFYKDELRMFLKTTFNWDWIDHAEITPRYDDNVVEIFDHSENAVQNNSIRISIIEGDKKSILRYNNKIIYEFIIIDHEIYWSINTKTEERELDFLIKHLVNGCNDYVLSLLIRLKDRIDSLDIGDRELLTGDENFIKALAERGIKISN